MKRLGIVAAFLLFVLLASPAVSASASYSLNSQYVNGFKMFSYPNSYLFYSGVLNTGNFYYFGNHVNFTTATITGQISEARNFGAGPKNGNTTLTKIISDYIELQLAFTSSELLYFYYYGFVPANIAPNTAPSQVIYTDSSASTVIPTGGFITSVLLFNACAAPCVWINPANYTMAIKSASLSGAVVDIFVPPPPNPGGGGGGTTTTTSTASNTGTATTSQTTILQTITTVTSTATFVNPNPPPPYITTTFTTVQTLPPCTENVTTHCEVTNPGLIGFGAIPSGPLLFVVLGGVALFAIVGIAAYRDKAAKSVKKELTFKGSKGQGGLDFSKGLSSGKRSGPMFRSRKRKEKKD